MPPKFRKNDAPTLRFYSATVFNALPGFDLETEQSVFTRAKMLRLIEQIYTKKKWFPRFANRRHKIERWRQTRYQKRQNRKNARRSPRRFSVPAIRRRFLSRSKKPRSSAAKPSIFKPTLWAKSSISKSNRRRADDRRPNVELFAVERQSFAVRVQSRLSRYVRGIGSLIDVNRQTRIFAPRHRTWNRRLKRRQILKGGKIRSALRLNEQLFVINKRYDANGRAFQLFIHRTRLGTRRRNVSIRRLRNGKNGREIRPIIKHYYTGVDLTKAY
jgi:hypothetical protein